MFRSSKAITVRRRIAAVVVMLALLVGASLAPAVPQAAEGAEPGLEERAAQGTYVVQRGDTLAAIAARLGVSMTALVQANGIRNPNFVYVGQRLTVPGAVGGSASPGQSTSSGVHVVLRGETLARIAARYGTTVSALVLANGLRNPNFIWVGQRLKVSSGGSTVPQSAPQPAPAPTAGRWIDVNLSQQRLTAYEGQTAVFGALVSTGLPRTPTVVGRYTIRTKYVSQAMSGPGYYLPNVPYVMYFYAGYSIHGTYWHSNFGHPMSHGCVNIRTPDAAWLFGWASIGTPVVTHY